MVNLIDFVCKIEHVGVYFVKKGCKIEDGLTDIFGSQVRYFVFNWRGVLSGLYIRIAYKLCSPKNG